MSFIGNWNHFIFIWTNFGIFFTTIWHAFLFYIFLPSTTLGFAPLVWRLNNLFLFSLWFPIKCRLDLSKNKISVYTHLLKKMHRL